jgi:hypothetical protein
MASMASMASRVAVKKLSYAGLYRLAFHKEMLA